ncbi:MAG: molecular chaperone TorD family protein [Acidobacteria bacterium]|nr:molecular chaperone TorD family protein [Acidobacteriota bacterium]
MTTAADAIDPVVGDALRDAAAWRLLARLFECPSEAWRRDIAALSRELGDAPLVEAARLAVEEASEGLYHSIFGPGGPAPPREVSYHATMELGSLMSSLTGFYGAFGYQPAITESPDHIAVESGFLAFLNLKRAYALIEGNEEHKAITAAAARDFRIGHLAMYAERLATILADAPAGYLQMASRILADRVGPRPGPRQLLVIQPEPAEDGGEFACDM